MKTARSVALALLAIASIATVRGAELPESALAITIDRQGFDPKLGRYEVIARLTNGSIQSLRWADIRCDIFDANGRAVGTSQSTVKQVAAGRIGVIQVGAFIPSGVDGSTLKAECRVTENYAE